MSIHIINPDSSITTPSGMMVKTPHGWYYWTHSYSEYGHRFEPFEPVATLSIRLATGAKSQQ